MVLPLSICLLAGQFKKVPANFDDFLEGLDVYG